LILTVPKTATCSDIFTKPLQVISTVDLSDKEVSKINLELENQRSLLKQLIQAVLQEAVQGKLTAAWHKQRMLQLAKESGKNLRELRELRESDPDNSAKALLEKIKAEKEKLTKGTKGTKRMKELPPISDEDLPAGKAGKPFDLPKWWVWCRLGDISNYGIAEKIEPKQIKSDTWVLELEDIEKITSKLLKRFKYVDRKSKSTKSIFKKDYVLYGKLRPYLDKVLVADDDGVCTTEIMPIKTEINPYYLRISLKTKRFIEYTEKVVSGMRMPRLRTEDARKAILSIPPLAE